MISEIKAQADGGIYVVHKGLPFLISFSSLSYQDAINDGHSEEGARDFATEVWVCRNDGQGLAAYSELKDPETTENTTTTNLKQLCKN